ncbi:MAG: septal ring lytic transglycosylase RlpA family protein [Bacteroidota bacterium]|nr:septal ring lytic transglycosylase RlpA family protein [Bacteroidota bacterium]MDP4233564.1 septal ring lytic transglycosylase RlpA family protein [Bacteroidota bacterium]MDP4243661.1 septal ring lytic transglycosylase RlpA family protein [Bacteroidota bacterium]MDP4287750.1 septal ring lytic transglycosylase RlpA family protein [Bacteroidota bacterium]
MIKATNPTLIYAMNSATQGLASWYGGMFHGHKTAMGTTYNMYAMTAAHRSLPLGTWVQVTNEQNGKSAIVQVTDRGPYVANRIMDLSYAAAQKLGYASSGTTHISMKVIGQGYQSAEEAAKAIALASNAADATNISNPAFQITPTSFTMVSTDYRTLERNRNTLRDSVTSLMDAVRVVPPVSVAATVFA